MKKVIAETAGGWGCPHELAGYCQLRQGRCLPGRRGCVLYGLMNVPVEDETGEQPEHSEEDSLRLKEKYGDAI